MANLDAILKFAERHGLFVLEDAAESIGVRWRGRHVGTFGDVGMISFYANKTITTAEGAVLLTQDEQMARRLYQLKNHGRDKKGIFIHDTLGFNFSFSDLHAAIGVAQMKKIPEILLRKQRIFERYFHGLSDISALRFASQPEEANLVHWFTNIEVPAAQDLSDYLKAHQVGSRLFFYPLHRQPCYKGLYGQDADFPMSVRAFERGLSLPSSVTLQESQQAEVIALIRDYFQS